MYVHVCMYMYVVLCCLPRFTIAHFTLILEVLTILEMTKNVSCISSDTADGTGCDRSSILKALIVSISSTS